MGDTKNRQEGNSLNVQVPDDGLERDLRAILDLQDDEDAPSQDEPSPAPKQGEGDTDQAAQQQQQPAPTPEPTVKIGDEEVPISQVKEWRMGYLRMQDYTRKTQELAREREQLQQQLQQIQPLLVLSQVLQTNPRAAVAFDQAYRQALYGMPAQPGAQTGVQAAQAPGQALPAMPVQPFVPPQLLQAVEATQQRLAEIELDRNLAQLRQEVNSWRKSQGMSELSDAEWDQVSRRIMQEALDTEQTDLMKVWRASDLRAEWLNQREQQRLAQQQQAAAVAQATLRGTPPAPTAKPPQKKPANLKEAQRLAAQDQDLMRELWTG